MRSLELICFRSPRLRQSGVRTVLHSVPAKKWPILYGGTNSTFRVDMRYGELNGQDYSVIYCYRTDDCRPPSSTAAAARSADHDEFLGAAGRLHNDRRLELRKLHHAQQQRGFDPRFVFHGQ